METENPKGEGALHLPDGQLWARVRYDVDRYEDIIEGQLELIGKSSDPGPFDPDRPFCGLTPQHDHLALEMADGRWWLCLVYEDGSAENHAGIRPAGRQPQP